jgi:hypothetical protein
VTFTLPGFATVQRAGVELSGSFTARINADLRVGGIEETITVTGETPVVDVQSTRQQRGWIGKSSMCFRTPGQVPPLERPASWNPRVPRARRANRDPDA